MKLRELITTWGFEVDDSALDDMEDKLDSAKDSIEKVGAAVIATTAAFFGLATATSILGKNLAKISSSYGIDTKKLQEYRFAAEQMGIEASTMDSALSSLATTMAEAREGYGSGREGIELMSREAGVSLSLTGDLDSQFEELVGGLGKVQDINTRGIIAEKFFGGNAREMMILFDQGADGIAKMREEFKRLGGGMTKEGVQKSKAFTKAMNTLMTVMQNIGITIGEHVMPWFTMMMDELSELIIASRDFITSGIKDFWEVFSGILEYVWFLVKGLVKVLNQVLKPFGGLAKILKVIAGVIAVIIGYKIVLAIIATTKVVWALFTALLAVKVTALAIPLAIMAIVAAIALLVEDFYVWTQGGDSMFGRLFGIFEGVGDRVKGWFKGIWQMLIGMVNRISDKIKTTLPWWLGGVKEIKTKDIDLGKSGKFSSKSIAEINAGAKPGSVGDMSQSNNETKIANITINAGGATPEGAKEAVQTAVADQLRTHLRQTNRDATPSVVY